MASDFPEIKKHLFLTGERGVGKSTLLHRLIEANGLVYSGFETQHIELDGMRRAHVLHGFVDLPPYENDCICCARIGEKKSVPVLPVFEENGVAILKKSLASPSAFILMDELGRLEKQAGAFIDQIYACLDSQKRVLGVLQKCSSEHVEAIARREDVTVLTVTQENRDELLSRLVSEFK